MFEVCVLGFEKKIRGFGFIRLYFVLFCFLFVLFCFDMKKKKEKNYVWVSQTKLQHFFDIMVLNNC